MRHLTWIVLAALLLSGCGQHGIFRDRGFDYLQARVAQPLAYPDGMTPIPAQELYPVPDAEQRQAPSASKKKRKIEVPLPPQLVTLEQAPEVKGSSSQVVPETRVVLTRDGNNYPVLMLDLDFDWAWQEVGDALKQQSSVKVEDIDRGLGVYFIAIDGKRNSVGEPWQLKLNYTANGIQVALQVDENAMAPVELSAPLMEQLKDGIR